MATDAPPAAIVPVLYDMYSADTVEVIVRATSHALHDGVLLVAPDGTVLWHNPVAVRLLRTPSEHLLGRSMTDTSWHSITLDGSSFPTDRLPAAVALATGEVSVAPPIGSRTGDSRLRWFAHEATPVEVDGERHAIVIFTDITAEVENRRGLTATLDELRGTLVQTEMPSSGAVRFAAVARRAAGSDSVDGDFYGAAVDGSSASFFIGDVSGRGIRSVALSAVARTTLRALARVISDPADITTHLHDLIHADRPQNFLSAVVGRLDWPYGVATLHLVSAGHPLPILIRNERAVPLGTMSPLVGMQADVPRGATRHELRSGDRVLLYTDGLIDAIQPRMSQEDLLARIPVNVPIDIVVDTLARMFDVAQTGSDGAALLGFEIR